MRYAARGFAAAAGIATIAYVIPGASDEIRAGIIVGIYAAAAVAVVLGVVVHRPASWAPWTGIAGFLAAWGTAWWFWEDHILREGATPPADSLIHLTFVPGYLLLAGALGIALLRRERGVGGLVDAGIVAAAGGTLAWSVVLHAVFDAGDSTASRVFPLVHGFADVVVAALLLRLGASRGFLRERASIAIAAGCVSVLISNTTWNWATAAGWYSPGIAGDLGWLVGPAIFGVAALAPSMASLGGGSSARRAVRTTWSVLPLLLVASMIPPVGLLLFDVDGDPHNLIANSIGSTLISILVIMRLALIISEQGGLVATVARQNERLVEGEERLRSIFEHSPVGIAVLDLDGRIDRANQRRLEMLGLKSSDDLVGRRLGEFVHPEDRPRLERMLQALAAGTIETGALEKRDISAGGNVIWVCMTASVVHSDDGRPRYIAVMAEDVTERRKLEREREAVLRAEREQTRRLLELDRLKDEFVATVSHELRTPLTSICGYLELVLGEEAGELNEEQRRFLEIVERNADRLLRLVGDLLFAAQVEAHSFTIETAPLDLAELAAEVVTTARPFAQANGVELDLDTAAVEVEADRARIAQVLDNLISNACKFTPDGGHVTVRVRERAGRATVEVQDTGVGIAEHEVRQLFDRFYRAKGATENAVQGTGLGLPIAKAIAEAHGGGIEVDSIVGEGSTFTLWLPLEQGDRT